jgi:hypothetical protein
MIRTSILAAMAICQLGAATPAPAQTAVSQYPFCIQGEDNPGWSGCSFPTLDACQAAASGIDAECLSNPWYQAGTNGPPSPDNSQIGIGAPLPVGPPPD